MYWRWKEKLRFYHSTAINVTRHIIEELTEKRFVRIVRFLYHVKRIINSVYIFFFLWCFSISYKDINFCTRLLRRLDKIGEQWTFFLRLCPLFCEYNCLSFKKLLLRVFFLRCHLIFQFTFIWSTYMEYVSLPVKFASLL